MRFTRIAALAAATTLALGLAGCASGSTAGDNAAGDVVTTTSAPLADGTFPVTIQNAFGTATIEKMPERIATVGWANQEVPLAFGIVPVGMAKVTWGDDDKDGVLPWVEDKLTELGADTPVLWDETNGPDFEAVADTQPDVILAGYSGLTQEEYDTLSKIAPVVAFPEVAWGTSMDDMITLQSAAIGKATSGADLIADLNGQVDAALDAHPTLKESTVLFTAMDPTDLSQVGYYTALDTRPGFLADHGLALPKIVQDSADSTEFYLQVSSEQAELFDDVDAFVTYGDDSTVALMQGDPLLSKIPAVAAGKIAILPADTPMANVANPSPLSVPWGLDGYFDILEAALLAQ